MRKSVCAARSDMASEDGMALFQQPPLDLNTAGSSFSALWAAPARSRARLEGSWLAVGVGLKLLALSLCAIAHPDFIPY